MSTNKPTTTTRRANRGLESSSHESNNIDSRRADDDLFRSDNNSLFKVVLKQSKTLPSPRKQSSSPVSDFTDSSPQLKPSTNENKTGRFSSNTYNHQSRHDEKKSITNENKTKKSYHYEGTEIEDHSKSRPPVMPRKFNRSNEEQNSTDFESNNLSKSYNFVPQDRSIKSVASRDRRNNLSVSLDSASSSGEDSRAILRGIFSFDGRSVDLELVHGNLKWKSISERSKSKRKSADSQMEIWRFYCIEPQFMHLRANRTNSTGRQPPNLSNNHNNSSVDLSKSVSGSLASFNSFSDPQTIINGFRLHYFDKEQPNVYRPNSILFNHPHSETCRDWIVKIMQQMDEVSRPRSLVIFLNPYSGIRRTRLVLNKKVIPVLQSAQITFVIYEFHDRMPIWKVLKENNIKFDNYDGIVIMAGDSSVSKVINAIIEHVARTDHSGSIDLEDIKNRLRVPISIIPVGTTNLIANSLYGSNKVYTALHSMVYGHVMRVDLQAAFRPGGKLHSFSFAYSCGLGTSLTRYLSRYRRLGKNNFQAAVSKLVTKAEHKLIKMEIDFIRDTETQPLEPDLCVKGCQICHSSDTIIRNDTVERFDMQSYQSNNSKKEPAPLKKWENISGSFISASLLVNSMNLDDTKAGGLSKYAHLADGSIDLVLVNAMTRKDLYRFIKRHSKLKNQFEMPFVKAIRVKEAKIKILNSVGDDAFDLSADHEHRAPKYQPTHQTSLQNFFPEKQPVPSSSRRSVSHFQLNKARKQNELDDDEIDDEGNQIVDSIDEYYSQEARVDPSHMKPPIQNKQRIVSGAMNGREKTSNQKTVEDLAETSSLRSARNSLKKKSQSIVNFFKKQEAVSVADKKEKSSSALHLPDHVNQNQDYGTDSVDDEEETYLRNVNDMLDSDQAEKSLYHQGNNFSTSKSLKRSSVWTIDGNLHEITNPGSIVHIKCLKQFLPVFAHGPDDDTELMDSQTDCMPVFKIKM